MKIYKLELIKEHFNNWNSSRYVKEEKLYLNKEKALDIKR